MLPFVLTDPSLEKPISGVIVNDPTYDQLWDDYDKNSSIRNAVFLKLGDKWDYRTHWKHGRNLYPDWVLNLDVIKHVDKIDEEEFYHQNPQKYLVNAFDNPIDVNVSIKTHKSKILF